jgi:hypothetical protein
VGATIPAPGCGRVIPLSFTELSTRVFVAPDEIVLIPADPRTRDGRGPYRFTADELIARSLDTADAITIDINHAREHDSNAPAAGYITGLGVRGDGAIVGEVRWTARGRAAVESREYKFISPVFRQREGTITRILRAALTNSPNFYATDISLAETNSGVTMNNETNKDRDGLTAPERKTCDLFAIAPADFLRSKANGGNFTVDKSWKPAPRPPRFGTAAGRQ